MFIQTSKVENKTMRKLTKLKGEDGFEDKNNGEASLVFAQNLFLFLSRSLQ